MHGFLVQINVLDHWEGVSELESDNHPIFERGAQFTGAFLERRRKGNYALARWNTPCESPVIQLVKFGLGNRSFQVFTQDVADRHEYSIGDETQDVKQKEKLGRLAPVPAASDGRLLNALVSLLYR